MAVEKKKEAAPETKRPEIVNSVESLKHRIAEVKEAQRIFSTYTQEQVAKIFLAAATAANKNRIPLAKMAVEETKMGVVEDKVTKNHFASEYIYNAFKDRQTCGVLEYDPAFGIKKIYEPIGVIAAVVPTTNPTSTAIFKCLICLKTRNGMIVSPHPTAKNCTIAAVKTVLDAAVEAGAPENVITCVTSPSIGATNELMKSKEVAIIIATGGPGMVKAAYSAGKPALGVGAGNSPAYIEKTANIEQAVRNIMASKTFDNGTICASEQSIICEECNEAAVIQEFKKHGGYFMTKEETDKVCKLLFKNGHAMNAKFVGRSPQVIASAAGIEIPQGTKVLIGRQNGVGEGNPLSFEKLTTVLGFYTVKDCYQACDLSIELLQNGIGHTMSIHTENKDIVMKFAKKPASRILVNTGGTQGGTGASTGLNPSFTLGCGTWGGSSVSENVTPEHLINIKRVAYGLKDCATLASNDPTFNCIKTAENCHSVQNQLMNMSPAQIAAAAAALNKDNACVNNTNTCTECNTDSTKNEELLDLVNQIVAAMKGAN